MAADKTAIHLREVWAFMMLVEGLVIVGVSLILTAAFGWWMGE